MAMFSINLEPGVTSKVFVWADSSLFNLETLFASKNNSNTIGMYVLPPPSYFNRTWLVFLGPHRHYASRDALVDSVLGRIRYLMATCPSLRGFFVFHSFGGGTGSGSGALLRCLSVDNGKKATIELRIDSAATLPLPVIGLDNRLFTVRSISWLVYLNS